MEGDRANEVTRLLADIGRGDAAAAERLLPVVYEELRALAGSFLRAQRPDHTLQPTALVHEAYMRLARAGAGPDDEESEAARFGSRAHFFAVASKAMRQILINHARDRRRQKRGGEWKRVTLSDVSTPNPGDRATRDIDILALDEALEQLQELDPRQCRIVELRYFGGLTVAETAEVLDVSPRTVQLDWRMARLWLQEQLEDGRAE